jgi:Zn-finger nucleic acid-binding protein
MQCPACGHETTSVTVADVTVDVCKDGCGGVWFDAGELGKLEKAGAGAGESLLDAAPAPDAQVDPDQRLHCPTCDDVVLARHPSSAESPVLVDECPSCGGDWLNAGELRAIEAGESTEPAREQEAAAYFDQLFGAQLQAEHEKGEAEFARGEHFAHTMRFICPSHYVKH